MTPEELQQAIQISRQHDIYSSERDIILSAIGRAYVAMMEAISHYTVLEQRINSGDLTAVQTRNATDKIAMAGQDAVIQQVFTTATTALEEAQAIVYELTTGRFLPNVPLPQPVVEEPTPE